MLAPLQIQPATLDDAEDILALQRCAYQQEARRYDDFTIAPLLETLEELRARFAHLVILKALCDGTIIGSVRAEESAGTCRIGRLIVHPDHQRRGIGTALMHAIEARFPNARFELFTGHLSDGNIRLYQHLGYTIYATEPVTPALSLVYLEKKAVVTT
jgi:GNAT superfamily N-acetyltransferase